MTEKRVPSKDDYPYRVDHVGGCGLVAFLLKRMPKAEDPMLSDDAIFPDGTAIEKESAVTCHACGKPFLDMKLSYVSLRP